MIKQIGPPSFFLTFSAADSRWIDSFKYMLDDESMHKYLGMTTKNVTSFVNCIRTKCHDSAIVRANNLYFNEFMYSMLASILELNMLISVIYRPHAKG